jgi:two-component system cell cycle sensor histidine kinase PleC
LNLGDVVEHARGLCANGSGARSGDVTIRTDGDSGRPADMRANGDTDRNERSDGGSERNDKGASAKSWLRAQRSIVVLAVVFLLAFVGAVFVHIEASRRDAMLGAIERQTAIATLLGERVSGSAAAAWGASSGAAEVARLQGDVAREAGAIARAARHARPVRAAAVFDGAGALLAITDPALSALAAAGVRAAGAETVWIGVPRLAEQDRLAETTPAHPVIVRRVGQHAIVSILDAAAMAPALEGGDGVVILGPQGALLYASDGVARDRALLEAVRGHVGQIAIERPGAALFALNGKNWAVGAAPALMGGGRVLVVSETASPLALLLRALASFAILAAAPFAAVGVLMLLLRQNTRRAEIAEQEAERAVDRWRLAADGAKAGVFDWAVEDDRIELAEEATRLVRSRVDTLDLTAFIALAYPDDRGPLEDEFRRARETGLLDARFRVGHPPSLAWMEARGTLIRTSSEDGAARLFGTIIDVTSRYEAEARASRLERQLRAALESYTGPFALWDARRRLVLWNQTYAGVFNLGPELLRPRASYAAIAAAASARIRRESVNADESESRVIELSSGEWLQIVERPTPDGGLVTVGVDITALKTKEQELARSERRLSEALSRSETQEFENKALAEEAEVERRKAEDASRAKSAFLANMSHELRTPLNAIIGFSEMMGKELLGPIGNDQYRGYANDIWESGNHLLLLINDILDMAKIEAGKFSLAPRPLAVIDMIEVAVRMNKPAADRKNLPLMVDAQDLPEIEADARAIKQIISNLLSNAIKFTEAGMIVVQARPTAWGLVVRVADTGCGIPEEHLKDIATPFKQVDAELSRNHTGTGLGLALTKTLAEMHGGAMKITSEVGKGTIVSIYLPTHFGSAGEGDAAAAE